jgi:DNA repair protein RadA
MRRPNKQKAEGVMIPLDVPGMAPTTEIRYEIRDDGLY